MKFKNILNELKEHLPFTATATAIAIVLTTFLLIKNNLIIHAASLFYIFHPLHLFFSAIVSAAIFYKYRKNIFLSLITGIGISILVGSISDVIFPYFGSLLFNIPISFHLPIIEKPAIMLAIALLGSSIGIIAKRTKLPHFLHVFISVFASLLYIFAYSTNFSIWTIFLIFIITILSVVIPCCLSDIVFPILCNKRIKIK